MCPHSLPSALCQLPSVVCRLPSSLPSALLVIALNYTGLYNRDMASDMKRHWFFILLSLAERDRHGSGIVRDVLELTGGDLRLWPVTLYGSLDELRENSWIRELDAAPDTAEDRGHRRWFRITPQGRRALAAEMERMQSLVAVAQRRLAGVGDPS